MTADPRDLPKYPFTRTCTFALQPEYGTEVARGRVDQVRYGGRPAWLVSDFAGVKEVLADSRMSVNGTGEANRGEGEGGVLPGFFLAMDPPEHDHLRRILAREFTPARMEKLRPVIENIADDLIGKMIEQGPPVDLVQSLALALPSLVICALLGVPYSEHPFFEDRTRVVVNASSTQEQVGAALMDVMVYLGGLAQSKLTDPGDDLLSLLVRHVETGDVSIEEVTGMATLLLMAGHETTGNMIALSTLLLLQRPDVAAELRSDPALMPKAVEELLRYLDIIGSLPRSAAEDMEIGGCPIRKGDIVVVATDAANRDAAVYPNPDDFDLDREGAPRHLSFGHGIHVCMGAPLARIELQVVLAKLLEKFPALALADPGSTPSFKTDAKIFGLYDLPVTW